MGKTTRADVFTVTSNADSGPGTLRDAIAQAAANGITVRDSIIFALSDISLPGRTITLLSPLPELTSNLVIDGVSQNGAAIGVSDARIMLFHGAAPGNFKFISVQDCTDVGIYGLAMINIANNYGDMIEGVSYVRCHHLQIGRPGEGNYIFGCTHAIRANTGTYGSGGYFSSPDTSRLLIIQSNIVGLDMNGGFSNQYNSNPAPLMFNIVLLLQTADIIVGGDDPAEGNTMVDQNSIPMNYPGGEGLHFAIQTGRDVNMGLLKIRNNKLGTRKDGTLDPNYRLFPVQIYILGNFRTDYKLEMKDNVLHGFVWMNNIGTYFTIQGNTIFTPWTNAVYDCAFTFFSCFGGGIVGGDNPGEGNTIMNAYVDTIYTPRSWVASVRFDLASHVTMRKNVTLCNNYYGSTYVNVDAGSAYNTYAYARVDSTAVGFVRGKATPNTRVDVYLDDDCLACEGKQWLGFTMASADSSWQYTGTFSGVIVATSTSPANGQTSPFSEPSFTDYWVRIKQPTCGKNNGYIKGMLVSGGDNVKWHYMTQVNGVWKDSLYSTALNLENAKPGIYYFDAWLGKTCRSIFQQFILYDTQIKVDSSYISVQQPNCGQFNGAIKGLYLLYTQDVGVYWKNEAGTIIGRQLDLTGAGPGRYKLVFQDTVGGCTDSTGFYELKNLSGPTVDINNALITPALCGRANGSITGIQFNNVTGVPFYQWVDTGNRVVGTSATLTGVIPGDYRLKFKDGGPCDTVVTPVFTIGNTGAVRFDSTALSIEVSKCTGATGGIHGLSAGAGSNYSWIQSADRAQVGTDADLSDVAPGQYKLIVTSSQGCIDSTRWFIVPQATAIPTGVTSVTIRNEVCGGKNALLRINTTVPDISGYSLWWVDSSTQQQVGTGPGIENIAAGIYYCYGTDVNGCTQRIFTGQLNNFAAPVISSTVQAYPDTCSLHVGGIRDIVVTGSSPFSYTWYDENGALVSSSPALSHVGSGNYYVIIQDVNRCSSTSPFYSVGATTATLPAPQYPVIYVLKNTVASLTVQNPAQGSYMLYDGPFTTIPDQQNSTGDFVIGPVGSDTAVYVVLKNGDCVSSPGVANIKILETLELVVPNAFTPNGDGHNDVFRIKNPGLVKTFELLIYNRWGQKVFSTNDPYRGWDGYFNGSPSSTGGYIWVIHFTDITGSRREKNGSILLIR